MRPFLLTALIILIMPHRSYSAPKHKSTSLDKASVSIVHDKNYLDLRIDTDKDGKIDYWEIQKNNLKVQIFHSPHEILYIIKKFDDIKVHEGIYIQKQNKFYRISNKVRVQNLFNYSSDVCTQDNIHGKTSAEITDIVDRSISEDLVKSNLDPDCLDSLSDVQKAVNPLIQQENEIKKCLSNAPLEIFQGFEIQRIAIAEKFSTYMEKIRAGTKEKLFVCSGTEFQAIEGGKINFPMSFSDPSYNKNKVFHEIIHISDVTQNSDSSEEMAKNLTGLCIDKMSIEHLELPKFSASHKGLPTTASDVSLGDKDFSSNASVDIPAAIAEPLQQSGPSVSPTNMNRVADSSGSRTATETSKKQTSSVVASAEALLGPTPAHATSSSANSGSSSRSPASASSSSSGSAGVSYEGYAKSSKRTPIRAHGRNEATMPKGLKRSGKLAPGEFIKEEVDLTRTAPAAASSAARGTARAPTSASPSSPTPTPRRTALESKDSETPGGDVSPASPSVAATGRSGASADLSPISNTPIGRRPPSKPSNTRTPASVKSTSETTNKIVEDFSTDYNRMKSRLRQTNFVETLRENSITVFDYSGNKYGAERGDIIFVDKGDRFVRQK